MKQDPQSDAQPMPRLDYAAPVGSIDLGAEGWEIWPCHDCLPWHLEVVRDPEDGTVLAREWHAIDCPTLQRLLADDDAKDGA